MISRGVVMVWLVSSLVLPGFAATSLPLVERGKSAYRIVITPQAGASERYAAQELRKFFLACTKIELPIVEGDVPAGVPRIVLGAGPVARKLGVDPAPGQLGPQGYLMRTVGPDLVIAGTRQGGTLYGVYDFLEQYLGVRWYAPAVTRTPATSDLVLPRIDRGVRPGFLYRNTDYTWPGGDADFRARMRDNRGAGDANGPYGVQYSFDGICHSYFNYISPGEFFKTHPEYFSEIGGVRQSEETQLCLTNPEVLNEVTRRMLQRMKSMPHVQQHNFSQMDWYNECQCAKCRAINQKYGTPGATQFWFVSQLAERTSKVYPDKLIGTLAYMYTEEPPKGLKMHPNVAVWLCHMYPSCDSHSIAACPKNADFKRRAIAWSRICSHLYVWDYIVDFAHYYNPFPNFGSMAADIKFFRDIGVEGLFLEGMPHGGGGGEFSLLRAYYGMKLLWNPDQDAGALIDDFLQGYYGPAAAPIREYITMLQDKVDKDDIHMHLYTNPAQGYLPDPVLRRAMAFFDRAEAAVKDDPVLLERVRVARMPLVYARCFPRNGYDIREGRLVWQGDMAAANEPLEFVMRMNQHGFRMIREVGGEPEKFLLVCSLLQASPVVHTLANPRLSVDVVPNLGGRVLRITDRQTGRGITAFNVTKSLFFPFAGGLEDRVGETFRSFGWFEPAKVIRQTGTSLTLVQTPDEFRLERTLRLDPVRPVLHVTSVLTNPGTQPRDARLRSHLELNLGSLRKTRVNFTAINGKKIDQDLTNILAAQRQGQYFYKDEIPRAEWRFRGDNGLLVTQRFDDGQLDFTRLYAYPEELNELEVELWSKRTTLSPGKSITLHQEIEVQRP